MRGRRALPLRIARRLLFGLSLGLSLIAIGGSTEGLILPEESELKALDPAVRSTLLAAMAAYRAVPAQAGDEARSVAMEQLARSFHAHGQLLAASAAYDAAIRLTPERHAPHYLSALLALGVGDTDRALAGLDRAIALKVDYTPAYLRRGDLQLGRGQLDAAAADFQHALVLQPGAAAGLAGLGRVALQKGDAALAATQLEAALQAQPGASRLQVALGLAYRKLGRIDDARRALNQRGDSEVSFVDPLFEATAALSTSPALLYERARSLAGAGRLAEAVATLAEAVALAPDEPVYQSEYGLLLFQTGDLQGAEVALAEAWANEPTAANTPALRARIAQAQGNDAKAGQHFAEVLALQSDADDARVELARLAMRGGRFDAAIKLFDGLLPRAAGAEKNYALYWSGLASAMNGDCPMAEQRLDEVFQASSGRDGWAMLGLSRLRSLCGSDSAEREQASLWAEQLYRQHPGVETAASLAMVAAASGDFARAESLQREAVTAAKNGGEPLGLVDDLEADLQGYVRRKLPPRAYSAHSGLLRED